jgi:hypothetical protein
MELPRDIPASEVKEADAASAPAARPLGRHLVFLAALAVAAVLIRGVRWDECYERAQVLAGLVQYPAGHPLYQYAHNAFSLQYHLSALLFELIPSAALLCALRQTLAICATVMPVFLLANLISGRIMPGYVAAALALFGSLRAFASYYPIFDWPDKFTCGHIGMGFMLITLYLALRGSTGTALFGLGASPAIHVGQTPVLALTMMLHTIGKALRERDRRWVRHAAPLLIAGVAVSAGTWLWIHAQWASAPAAGPYAENPSTAVELWRGYSHGEDIHRVFPRFNPSLHSHLLALMALSLGGLALLRRARREKNIAAWLLVYIALSVAVFYGVMAAESIMGDNLPPIATIWMPYRLMNHVAVILLAMAAGIAGSAAFGAPALAAAAAYPLISSLFSFIMPEPLWQRYMNAPEAAVFFLVGAAAAVITRDSSKKALYLTFPVFLAIALFHQFGAACMGAGYAAVWVSARVVRTGPWWRQATAAFLVAATAMMLSNQWEHRADPPVTAFQREVRAYLDAHGPAQAMLVIPHWEIDYQEATGHPVLYTFETPQLLTYMPAIAPTVINMRKDIYDIVLGRMWYYDLDAWKNRTRGEWRELAERYKFHYVISPNTVGLDLEPVVRGQRETMYALDAGTRQ